MLFAIAAKVDAERWRGWAWPLLAIAIVLLLIPVLPVPNSIAPRFHGSRRWVNIGFLFQSSEFAKLAVIVWTAMLIVKKGDKLRRLTKGLLPFIVVLAVLNILVILEPDLSMAMTFTLIMGIMLFAGGVRIGHVVFLGIVAIPLLWREVERAQYALLRMTSFLNPGNAPIEAGYQLKQSLIAVGSGGLFGVGFGHGTAAAWLRALSVQRLHWREHRRGVGLPRHSLHHARVRGVRLDRLPHREAGAHDLSAAARDRASPS